MSTTKNFSNQEILRYGIHKKPSIWARARTRLKGEKFAFDRRNPDGSLDLSKLQLIRTFLKQPLDDQSKWKSTQKARQLGLSENGVREVLWFADEHPFTKQVYVFPTDGQVKDFSRTRITEVIDDSPYLKQRMGIDPATGKSTGHDVVDNVRLKKIGNSYIFFRSGATPRTGEGIDCDGVYFDEIDRMHPNVTIAFNETLSASPYGFRRDISTPSLPGVGVNAGFQNSNQNHWFMKCEHCGNFFTLILEYPNCIVPIPQSWYKKYGFNPDETHTYICVKCGKPVSNYTRAHGFWYPLFKNKRISGYQLTQLIAPWISATNVVNKRSDYRLEQIFVNYVIGLPYLGDNILLVRDNIMACIDHSLTDPNKIKLKDVCIGGDWGNESWQIAGMPYRGKWLLLDLLKISDQEKVEQNNKKLNPHIVRSVEFFRKWNASIGVYDAGYGKDRNFELLELFKNRIFSCYYPNNETDYTKDFEDRWESDKAKVSVDRTMSLKVMVSKFVKKEIIIPEWVARNPEFETFIKHVTNLVSIKNIDEDEHGVSTIKERVGSLPGGDHFGHAMNYLAIALRSIDHKPKSDFHA